ncbi:hypothetical protein Q5752_007092 [Cryptotrichosporon argae]
MIALKLAALVPLLALVSAHGAHDHDHGIPELWESTYGALPDLPFSGITGFARLPHSHCLDEPGKAFDIAILGMPYDSSVSYRPGARFGPQAIRAGSRRHGPYRSFLMPWGFSALQSGLDIVDCNDVPISPYDPSLAISQIRAAYATLLARSTSALPVPAELAGTRLHADGYTARLARDGREHPRILTLGGDHTVVYPILGALHDVYGPISVLHFDAHLDTWSGEQVVGGYSEAAKITHGTFFWKAAHEGFIANGTSVHAGIRTRLSSIEDIEHDNHVGFKLLTTDDIDDLGADGIARRIKDVVGDNPVYLSFDIDTIDPSMAPATGTPESGGWTTRETKRILRALSHLNLNLVGADIVEVAPAYDHAELTAMAAADLAQELLGLMVRPAEPVVRDMQRAEAARPGARHDEL